MDKTGFRESNKHNKMKIKIFFLAYISASVWVAVGVFLIENI